MSRIGAMRLLCDILPARLLCLRTGHLMPTVLLVEADQDDRRMYAAYLRLLGFRTLEVADTGVALALADTADVIVTDLLVPGTFDGLELIRRLRANERTHHTPVIVLTACVSEPDQERAHVAGCDAFLPKPCLPETLVMNIQYVMAPRSRPRPRAGSQARSG